ncbi:LacI family DNA-binding transcriptional regulator [Streptomyces tropicalis]|uniref:LacI family DNA-binding transcriptional regulator n=1 Tax=Streptomyces tropicalis TaxID=3034234 RepID=A0ABT6A9D2_9ACTN|nr:LacI family DNA-binding transcriptional regulator [Streptomyces tropicalis]MDF3300951.1 LacI family DNA-binding transcriptional regulator [Streptomyces tropicalis]
MAVRVGAERFPWALVSMIVARIPDGPARAGLPKIKKYSCIRRGYGEKRDGYFRGAYRIGPLKYGTFGTIRRWDWGGGPTLKAAAKLAGVNTGTVSNVLSHAEVVEETRVHVTQAMSDLGYITAGPRRRRRPTGAAAPSDRASSIWRPRGHTKA